MTNNVVTGILSIEKHKFVDVMPVPISDQLFVFSSSMASAGFFRFQELDDILLALYQVSRLLDKSSGRLKNDISGQFHFSFFLDFLPFRKQLLQGLIQDVPGPTGFRLLGNPVKQWKKSQEQIITANDFLWLKAPESVLQNVTGQVFLHLLFRYIVCFQEMPAQQVSFYQ
jgi:hypothetical protein